METVERADATWVQTSAQTACLQAYEAERCLVSCSERPLHDTWQPFASRAHAKKQMIGGYGKAARR